MIGQGELVERVPDRVVRAPAGSSWWGVDASTLRVSIACYGRSWRVQTRSFPRLEHGARLAGIYAETLDLARELGGWPPPGVILVEQPFGRHVTPVLYYAVGCVMAALASAYHVPVEPVAAPAWKRHAVGAGNADKAQVMRWARDVLGYTGSLQDEADALGIAVAAQRTMGFVS